MKFAKWTFLIAGIYGIMILLPMYFLESYWNENFPPAITHPELFYGFVGVALSWQIVFIMISKNVQKYRFLMIPAVLEKFTYGIACLFLFTSGRLSPELVGGGIIDLVLGGCFVVAFMLTKGKPE